MPTGGIEPPTFTLQMRCSKPTELCRQASRFSLLFRTHNRTLNSFYPSMSYNSYIGALGPTRIRTEALGFKVPHHNQLDNKTNGLLPLIYPFRHIRQNILPVWSIVESNHALLSQNQANYRYSNRPLVDKT